jgi:hypothetical protein
MSTQNSDPLWQIAEQVAYCFSERGYAFVEDDMLETLTDVLRSFLTASGIPVHIADTTSPVSIAADQPCPPDPPTQTPTGRYSAASSGLQ